MRFLPSDFKDTRVHGKDVPRKWTGANTAAGETFVRLLDGLPLPALPGKPVFCDPVFL